MENKTAIDQTTQAIVVVGNKAREIRVVDQESLTAANGLLQGIKGLRLEIDAEFDPGIKQAHEHHKTLVAQKRKWTEPLDDAERRLKPLIGTYLMEQDRKRLEVARRQEEARLKAEMEAAKASDAAVEKIRNGDLDEADQVVANAAAKIEKIQAAAPEMPERPEAPGTSLRQMWTFEVIDKAKVPEEYKIVDERALRTIARGLKDQAKVPGVRFYAETTVATRIKE